MQIKNLPEYAKECLMHVFFLGENACVSRFMLVKFVNEIKRLLEYDVCSHFFMIDIKKIEKELLPFIIGSDAE